MSFRKRNVVLSGTGPAPGESSPRRPPSALGESSPSPRPGPVPGRASLPVRPFGRIGSPGAAGTPGSTASQRKPLRPPVRQPLLDLPVRTAEEEARLAPEKKRLREAMGKEAQNVRQSLIAARTQHLGLGARPSALDGRPITSTGTASLDQLLASYGGIVLGHSLLIEEQGTTDFASVMLRAYAAEGLVQGHHVHVLGVGPGWRTELPGLASATSSSRSKKSEEAANDRMKIAWRYEALAPRPTANAQRGPSQGASGSPIATFCHNFDLTKRLVPADIKGTLHASPLPNPLQPSPQPESEHSPLRKFLVSVSNSLRSTPQNTLHRIVLPNFLSPTLYALDGWSFPFILALLMGLRSLLREHGRRLTLMLSLSTTLYERDNEYVRQLEELCDSIIELIPLPPGPPSAVAKNAGPSSNSSSSHDKSPADKMQGWLKVHKLQIYSEFGDAPPSQGAPLRENLCFSVSRSKGLVVEPYSLPPIEDDNNQEKKTSTAPKKDGMEF
ncbi:Elongator subunit elp4 [Sporothrix eucalyptigena]|uniref:Elongator complex protein 4 n=1 Tax=Sporothrix eucalyptigena TaxID=1812306 RepID=A0ABP0AVL1_9PEZI